MHECGLVLQGCREQAMLLCFGHGRLERSCCMCRHCDQSRAYLAMICDMNSHEYQMNSYLNPHFDQHICYFIRCLESEVEAHLSHLV
jgi:hypothetical protein